MARKVGSKEIPFWGKTLVKLAAVSDRTIKPRVLAGHWRAVFKGMNSGENNTGSAGTL
jgi:hypothetical protein